MLSFTLHKLKPSNKQPSPRKGANLNTTTNMKYKKYSVYLSNDGSRYFVLDNTQLNADGILAHAILSEHKTKNEASILADDLNSKFDNQRTRK